MSYLVFIQYIHWCIIH